MRKSRVFATFLAIILVAPWAHSAQQSSVSQWGITWTFDRSYEVGQFVNGDWWVIGPVTIVSVSPAPGTAPPGEEYNVAGNQFGDAALQRDDRMRNGSMVVLSQNSKQGYDSRVLNYDAAMSISFPHVLPANRSLVSTASLLSTLNNPNFVQGHSEEAWAVLEKAAVLTSLSEVPPADAFRPPYGGRDKPIYRAGNLRRDLLPRLEAVSGTPSFELFERYFERPWLDHSHTWLDSRIAPLENMPGYGREYARLTSMASLMLLLDVPIEQKETLLIRFVQLGIDLDGIRKNGGTWPGEGGIWVGRKWPIVFAGIMLNEPGILPDIRNTVTRFSEDQQTYFGQGWNGATALFQLGVHHGIAPPYEEKDPATWTDQDSRSERYRYCCTSSSWIGTALAARYFGAMALWGHDAFFAYSDRWMEEEGVTWDSFVTAMWNRHRAGAPVQAQAPVNLKWVWDGGGAWEDNPAPSPGGPPPGPSDLPAPVLVE